MFPANHRCWLNNKPFHASGETGCNRRSSFQGKCCNAVYPRCSFAYISSVIRRKSVRSLFPVPGSSIRTFYWTSFFFLFFFFLQRFVVKSDFAKSRIEIFEIFFNYLRRLINKFWFVKLFKFIYNNLTMMIAILLKIIFLILFHRKVS